MNESLLANADHCPEQDLCSQAQGCADDTCVLTLCKLLKLRDALIVLKGPLAKSPAARTFIEQRLLSNEVYERVLGKLAADNRG
ncbi:hypothetical protein [Pseudomonas sp. DSV-1]|uniref:hypothetical protein n=1 Tax=Pseudomonas sp. DSV-1 TaxID=3112250 RepID=UPI002DBD91E6|nr:hypothetical protein [Pseudomonas sp. DSV-1]MEC4239010.1 hypothetical protein [Pseudomonas sp. DSV-1]